MEQAWNNLSLDGLPHQSLFPGVEFVRVEGAQAQFSHAWFKKGTNVPSATDPTHHHNTEEIVYVVRGALRMRVGEAQEQVILSAGDVIVLPANVPHGGEAIEDTETFAVNSPPRSDHAAAKLAVEGGGPGDGSASGTSNGPTD